MSGEKKKSIFSFVNGGNNSLDYSQKPWTNYRNIIHSQIIMLVDNW